MNFMDMLQKKWDKDKFVCLGLDPVLSKLPKVFNGVTSQEFILFLKEIIKQTADLVCCYKPNIAFYEAFGSDGISILNSIIRYIKKEYSDIPVILDGKRGDIGNTNNGYVQEAFEYFDADAITVPPYMGQESLKPFLDQKDKGVIVLCRTSNPGAGEFQDLKVGHRSLYEVVAENVSKKWNTNGNCAVVVGATYTRELAAVRSIVGDMPILIPGIGTQGGDIKETVKAGKNSRGQGMIINSSSAILYASGGKDYVEAARGKTIELHNQINGYLQQ